MPKVNFKYDYKKDAWSWVFITQDQRNKWGYAWEKRVVSIPKDIQDKILKKSRKSAESLVYKYLTSNRRRQIFQLTINQQMKAVGAIWRKIEKRFFKRMEKVTQKPIFWNNFGCYLTTGNTCPYNPKEKWFMISMWHNVPANIKTIGHEIFHLQFLHYYEKYCLQFLSEQQKEDLKEAITFILNTDFNDLLICNDGGYPNHMKLRKRLEIIWQKRKSFQEFLDKAIKITKKLLP